MHIFTVFFINKLIMDNFPILLTVVVKLFSHLTVRYCFIMEEVVFTFYYLINILSYGSFKVIKRNSLEKILFVVYRFNIKVLSRFKLNFVQSFWMQRSNISCVFFFFSQKDCHILVITYICFFKKIHIYKTIVFCKGQSPYY